MHTNEGAKGGGHGTCGLGGGRMVIEAIAGWDGWPDAAGPGWGFRWRRPTRRRQRRPLPALAFTRAGAAGDVRSSILLHNYYTLIKKGETAIKKGRNT